MRAIMGALLALALLFPSIAASAGTGERGRRTVITVRGDDYSYHFSNDRRGRRTLPGGRWALRFGAGMVSGVSVDNFLHESSWSEGLSLSHYYRDYNGLAKTAGSWSVGADYRIARWFAVSADIGLDFLWNDVYDGVSDAFKETRTGVSLNVLPQAKFYYLSRPAVRLYGYIGIGVVKYFGYDGLERSWRDDYGVHFEDESFETAVQFAPIGMEVGRRWFGFAEFGYGTFFSGLRAGLGYRF